MTIPGSLRGTMAALAALVAGAAFAAPQADAASYTVQSCRDADGDPLPTTAWRPGGNAGARADTCATGGALSAWLTPADTWGTAVSGYRFVIPHGVEFQQFRVWLRAQTSSTTSAGAYEAGVGQFGELSPAVIDHGCITAATSCDIGAIPGGQYLADSWTWPMLAVLALCPPNATCTPNAPQPARIDLYRSEVDFDDSALPTAGPVGGTIAHGPTVSGTRSVRGDLADVGSGVRRVQLLVDGAPVDQQTPGGRCVVPYTVADPCPDALQAAFDLDTTALGDGPHSVALRAIDAAGNATTGPPLTFAVDNRPPPPVHVPVPVPVPVPVAVPPAPVAPVAESHRPEEEARDEPPPVRRVRLVAPKRVRVGGDGTPRGHVAGADGSPKAGVRVTFQRRPIGSDDDAWRPFGQTTTGGDGRFTLPDINTSTEVRAVVADESLAAAPSVVRYVARLDAEIDVADAKLRNRDTLVLRGRFRRAGGALDERPVLVQAKVRGDWRTVDSVEADESGRVAWRYAFTNTRRTAIYRFRLVLPRSKDLPWKRLASEVVKVRVDGR